MKHLKKEYSFIKTLGRNYMYQYQEALGEYIELNIKILTIESLSMTFDVAHYEELKIFSIKMDILSLV